MRFAFAWRAALAGFVEANDERVPEGLRALLHSDGVEGAGTAVARSQWRNRLLVLLAETALDPALTFAVCACFRPLLPDLAARIAASVAQPSAASQLDLARHECACAALVCMASFSSGASAVLDRYLATHPPPFERIAATRRQGQSASAVLSLPEEVLLLVCRTSHRLRRTEAGAAVVSRWDWSPFSELLAHPAADIRWYAAQCVCDAMGLAADARAAFEDAYVMCSPLTGERVPEDVALSLRLLHLQRDDERALEQAVLAAQSGDSAPSDVSAGDEDAITAADLMSSVVDACGVLLYAPHLLMRPSASASNSASSGTLVRTATTSRSLSSLARAVSLRRPALLEGPTGAGKTSLVVELARMTGNEERLVRIHLGDQSDGKVLLGTYVCGDTPGEFAWQAGALLRAAREGCWLLLEDADLAPPDVLSVLAPLLERRRLFVAGRGETVDAAPDFRLFATQSLLPNGAPRKGGGAAGGVLAGLWNRVAVEAPTVAELTEIVSTRHAALVPVAHDMVSVYVRAAAAVSELRAGRVLSARELLRWCSRSSMLCANAGGGGLDFAALKEEFFAEAVDCFCAGVPDAASRATLTRTIGAALGLSDARVQQYLEVYRPGVQKVQGGHVIGRVALPGVPASERLTGRGRASSEETQFAPTRPVLLLMEQIAVAVRMCEPVLLVGETGTGKTTAVQHVADMLGVRLSVLNMSQQSDSADLFGGFRPVDVGTVCGPLVEQFDSLFGQTFSRKANASFLAKVREAFNAKRWDKLSTLFGNALQMVERRRVRAPADAAVASGSTAPSSGIPPEIDEQWARFSAGVARFDAQRTRGGEMAFDFVEGALVRAVRQGEWILLDEINLANPDTLESLNGLLESPTGSIVLTDKGELRPVPRHPSFRLFACMNPATDVGKRDLPMGLRSRMTEIYVDELSGRDDLRGVVEAYLPQSSAGGAGGQRSVADAVVDFYLGARKESASGLLVDGAGQRPHYSLRTLCRSLAFSRAIAAQYGVQRAVYEGLCMGFVTPLARKCQPRIVALIRTAVGVPQGAQGDALVRRVPQRPSSEHVLFESFWLEALGDAATLGADERGVPNAGDGSYILTPSIRDNLRNIARAAVTRRHPVLLQGPTSAGKTSMVEYLARATGHKFVRVNNHEHTDLQEYLGSYASDAMGRLAFREGILVEAVRKGHWLVLDELNLAPTDVLEALNRLLDDNRELLIPETGERVHPHPHFMLFATQNPPGAYGGRKVLSRAFRNRFVELHFDEIPEDELQTILECRCAIPPSYCKRLVDVMRELQVRRSGARLFAGKHGFITLRDLFRWANRHPQSYDELAADGYRLLAERVRKADEADVVRAALEKHVKVAVDPGRLYSCEGSALYRCAREGVCADGSPLGDEFRGIVWTRGFCRLFALVERCLAHKEPVLLVGETGCGKTTVFQLFAALTGKRLHIVNCHQHTETADFLGGLRPSRGKDAVGSALDAALAEFSQLVRGASGAGEAMAVDGGASGADGGEGSLGDRIAMYEREAPHVRRGGASEGVLALCARIDALLAEFRALFSWVDGPLVQAMRAGDILLIDEISLADDSVLERLNSVLEPARLLVLAEKGASGDEEIVAHDAFRIAATMNPGGDFGKKELSPALRNRFTEVWVPTTDDRGDLRQVLVGNFASPAAAEACADVMLDFVAWFRAEVAPRTIVSLRDYLSWVRFVNSMEASLGAHVALVHGACLVFLDGLGAGNNAGGDSVARRRVALEWFYARTPAPFRAAFAQGFPELTFADHSGAHAQPHVLSIVSTDDAFGVHPFLLPKGTHPSDPRFALQAPTTCRNLQRVLRGMQLRRPILLEGSPGVGKTSLVTALAAAAGYPIVRINLSDQTDVMDLFGSDLPVEGGKGGEFAWRDGPFLRAMRAGVWVLLDELNLAQQSVLEGLNACLDHRGTVYIPELDRTFECGASFRVFACQNPTQQGGGRKGLPKSFLNRFTQVYVDALTDADLEWIATTMYPSIPRPLLARMVSFNARLHEETMVKGSFGRRGAPWEFNLRDVSRWCDAMVASQAEGTWNPSQFLDVLYLQRMRTEEDRACVRRLFDAALGGGAASRASASSSRLVVRRTTVELGTATLCRQRTLLPGGDSAGGEWDVLHCQLPALESLMHCVSLGWMALLVGPSGAGKRSIVRLLARLTGNTLREFAMNPGVDTTELLGGFEQFDVDRHAQELATAISRVAAQASDAAIARVLSTAPASRLQVVAALGDVQGRLARTRALLSAPNGDRFAVVSELRACVSALNAVAVGAGLGKAVPAEIDDKLDALAGMCAETSSARVGSFEWVDGLLVGALERGDWVLIDNANLCPASVLDRLNPLLEKDGVLSLSESGVVDGAVRAVRPHPNFRIFMAMDPRNGDISRAMRNRGIELCFGDVPASASRDLRVLCARHGLAGGEVSRALASFHASAQATPGAADHPLSMREFLDAADVARDELERGQSMRQSLACAVEEAYVRSCRSARARETLRAHVTSAAASLFPGEVVEAGVWPRGSFGAIGDDALAVSIEGDGLFALHAALQLASSAGVVGSDASRAVMASFASCGRVPLSDLTFALAPAQLAAAFGALSRVHGDGSAQDVETLARWLKHALRHFVERATPADWALRCAWVEKRLGWLASVAPFASSDVGGALATLRTLFTHPLTAEVFAARASLFAVVGNASANLADLPLDLSEAPQFSRMTRLRASPDVGSAADAFDASFLRLSLAASRAARSALEANAYAASRGRPVPSLSLAQQSHCCYAEGYDRAQVSSPAAAWLHPYFSAFDAIVDEAALSVSARPSLALLRASSHMCRLRDALWDAAAVVPPAEGVVAVRVCWRWMRKDFRRFLRDMQSAVPGSSAGPLLAGAAERLDAALGTAEEDAAGSLALWKRGGHPRLLRNAALVGVLDSFAAVARRMDVNARTETAGNASDAYVPSSAQQNGGSAPCAWAEAVARGETDASAVSADVRQQVIESLASVFVVDEMGPESESGARVLAALADMPAKIARGVDALVAAHRPPPLVLPRATEGNELLVVDESQLVAPPLVPEDIGLWPVVDYEGTILELRAMGRLLEAVASVLEAPHSALSSLDSANDAVAAFYAGAEGTLARPPADLVPYRRLLWLLRDARDSLRGGQATARTLELMPALLSDVRRAFHAHVWQNTFNDLSFTTWRPPVAAFEAHSRAAAGGEHEGSSDAVVLQSPGEASWGSARISDGVRTSFAMPRIACAKEAGIYMLASVVAEFTQLGHGLWSAAYSGASAADVVPSHEWDVIAHTAKLVVSAHLKHFPLEARAAVTASLSALCHPQDAQSAIAGAAEARRLLPACAHPGFARVVPLFVRLVDAILEGRLATDAGRSHAGSLIRGRAWVLLGCVELSLLRVASPVDPASKYAIQMDRARAEAVNAAGEADARSRIEAVETGRTTNAKVEGALERQRTHESRAESLSLRCVLRPVPSAYAELHAELTHFSSSVGDAGRIVALADALAASTGAATDGSSLQREEQGFQASASQFDARLARRFPMYRDVWQPLCVALGEARYGLRIIAAAAADAEWAGEASRAAIAVVAGSTRDSSLDVSHVISLAEALGRVRAERAAATVPFGKKVDGASLDRSAAEGAAQLRHSVLRAVLARAHATSRAAGHRDPSEVLRVIDLYVEDWERHEKAEAERVAREGELFKYKMQRHEGGEEAARAEEERSFEAMFPRYADAFSGLDAEAAAAFETGASDETPEMRVKRLQAQRDAERARAPPATRLSPEDVERVVAIHAELFDPRRTRGPFAPATDAERLECVVREYDAAFRMLRAAGGRAPAEADSRLLGAHVVLARDERDRLAARSDGPDAAVPARAVQVNTAVSRTELARGREFYNVYSDANVAEARLALPALSAVDRRVRELLLEWPEHPVLQSLLQIADRIMGFPLSSPVVQLVLGLEMLLRRAQDWEQYAAKRVSLAAELEGVTALIVRWRKLELKSWAHALDAKRRESDVRAFELWFHMYRLLRTSPVAAEEDACRAPGGPSASAEGPQEPLPSDDPEFGTHLRSIFESMERFLQAAPLGEFSARLDVLWSLSGQCAAEAREAASATERGNMPAARYRVALARVLDSFCRYYEQLRAPLEAHIARGRAPIDKELGDFAKIARWNDVNYWALRDAADKAHRTLHRLVRKYAEVLAEPSAPVLATAAAALATGSPDSDCSHSLHADGVPAARPAPLDPSASFAFAAAYGAVCAPAGESSGKPSEALLPRVPSLHARMVSHRRKGRLDAGTDARVEAIDALAVAVAERAKELREWVPPPASSKDDDETKAARVRAIHHQQQLKRVALADLLKTLRRLGLSFRSSSNRRYALTVDVFALPRPRCTVIDATVAVKVDAYFFKCVAGVQALRQASLAPSRELGVASAQKCAGFAEHLFVAVAGQRQLLADTLGELAALDAFVSNVSDAPAAAGTSQAPNRVLPPQAASFRGATTALQALTGVCESLSNAHLVLDAAASLAQNGTDVARDTRAALAAVGAARATATAARDALASWASTPPSIAFMPSLAAVASAFGCASAIEATLAPALETMAETGVLRDAAESVAKFVAAASQFAMDTSATSVAHSGSAADSAVVTAAEGVLRHILLALQRAREARETASPARNGDIAHDEPMDSEEVREDSDALGIVDGHAVDTHRRVLNMARALDVPGLNARCRALHSAVSAASEGSDEAANAATGLLCLLSPVLCEYRAVVQGVVDQMVRLHVAVCKLERILLALFVDLLTNGFCTPADAEEEAGDGEGKGELQGTGIGEGKGGKDVSKDIENEGQVQGTRDEQKEEDEGGDVEEEDDGIEMNDDFEGRLYDVEPREEEEGKEDESEGDKGEEDMDVQMGELDQKKADVVDEKMWGEDSDDEETPPSKDEKTEKGASMSGGEKESELVAKNEDDAGAGKEEKKDKKDKKGAQEETKKQKEEGAEEGDEGGDGEGDEGPEINEDTSDKYEENHGIGIQPTPAVDEGEEGEDLPEDMSIDGDEGADADDNAANGSAMPEDAGDMDGGSDSGEDEGGESEPMDADAPPEHFPEVEQPEGEEDEGENGPQVDREAMEVDAAEEEAGGNEEEGRSPAPVPLGAEAQGEAADDEKEKGAGLDAAQTESVPTGDDTRAPNEMPLGVSSDAGGMGEAQSQPVAPQQGGDNNASDANRAAHSQPSDGDEGRGKWQRTVPQHTPSGGERERPKEQPSRQQEDVNPYRDVGSLLDKWRERLKMVERDDADAEHEETRGKESEDAPSNGDAHEFVKKGEDDEGAREQTRAAATEEQLEAMRAQAEKMEVDNPQQAVDDDGDDAGAEEPERPRDGGGAEADEPQDAQGLDAPSAPPSRRRQRKRKDISESEEQPPTKKGKGAEEDGDGAADAPDVEGNAGERAEDDIVIGEAPQRGEEMEGAEDEDGAGASMDVDVGEADGTVGDGERQWQAYESSTSALSQDLCEQLRLILEPTLATRLRGDYRTGKRLNMRRVIPYIASDYKKDKIWLRRTRPSKRQYQVMLAIDDSTSMAHKRASQLALKSLALIGRALARLEVGDIAVCSFGESVRVLHPFGKAFTDDAGASVMGRFTFAQDRTDFAELMRTGVRVLRGSRPGAASAGGSFKGGVSQLMVIISDGTIVDETRETTKWISEACGDGILPVFVVVDDPRAEHSVMDVLHVTYPNGVLTVARKLDLFPFPYYVILRDIAALPEVLADALRQWFEIMAASDE